MGSPPATASAAAAPVARGARGAAIAVCCLGAFLAFLDMTIVNVAFPDIARAYPDAGLPTLSWVVNGYNVVFAAFLVPAGRAADRIGRRRSFVAGLLLFTVASGACAAAGSAEALIAARVVQAAGAAILVPTSLALMLPAYPLAERFSGVALWGAAGALAAGIGPSLGGVLVEVSSWRSVFLINIPIGLLIALLARRALAEQRERDGQRPDVLGGAMLAAAFGLLSLGIVKANDWDWTGAATLACLAAGALLLPLVALRCARHPSPVVDPELVTTRTGAVGNLAALLFSVGFYSAIFNNVLFLSGVWGWSVLTVGLAISPAPLTMAVVARPAGRLAERYGARRIIIPGVLVYIVGTLLLVWGAGRDPDFLAHWLPGALLVGAGIGLCYPNMVGAALARVEATRLATGSAVNSAGRQLGGVLGIAVLISFLAAASASEQLEAHRAGWYMAIVLAAASGLVAMLLPRDERPAA